MSKESFLPCPICSKEPDIQPGLKSGEKVIGQEHWQNAKCPFRRLHRTSSPKFQCRYEWNSCVRSFEEFRNQYAGQVCPVCGEVVTTETGYDREANALRVSVSCGCTEATANDVSHAVNLWLDRHESAAEKRLTANRQAEDISRLLPGVVASQCPVGDPIDWTVRYRLAAMNRHPHVAGFESKAGVKTVAEGDFRYYTTTVREYDARRATLPRNIKDSVYQAAWESNINLVADKVTRA